MVCHFDTRRHNSVCVSTLQNPTPLIRWTLFIFKGVYVCLFHGSSISFDDYLAALDMCNGEGNSNPLQYSCLENPMDRGAWWASPWGPKERHVGVGSSSLARDQTWAPCTGSLQS